MEHSGVWSNVGMAFNHTYQVSKQARRQISLLTWWAHWGSPQSISKVVLAVVVEAMLPNLGKDFSGWFIMTGLTAVCYKDSCD